MTFGRRQLPGEGGRCHMASDSTSERIGLATLGRRPGERRPKGEDVLRSLAPARGGESEPPAFGRLVGSPRCHMASKVGQACVNKGSLNFTNRARLLGEREKQGDAERSDLGLPQREKVRPTIWQTAAPLAPTPVVERTETAQGPRAMGAEVRGVGSRKRDGSTGKTSGLDEKRVRF